jgi:pyruvate/2-oxoacid:ferredoxin oxidoreductase beta subunit
MKESRLITFDNAVYSVRDIQNDPKTDIKTENKVLVNGENNEKITENCDVKPS